MRKITVFLFIILMLTDLWAQSGKQYRRYNIMNKNLVSTVYTNGGVIGHPVDKGPRGAWLNDNNGYLGDVSPFVGAEIPYKVNPDSTFYFHSVTYCLADKRPNRQENSSTGDFWGFEPKRGYFDETKEGPAVALFTNPSTWPQQWPDRMDDVVDPGWSGKWNGYFGKGISNATEETYFAMDDNADAEFNFAANNKYRFDFKPDSLNTARSGMALEMKVRALQWRQFLAQDCIFWLYEITNEGTTDYNKTTFGMLVGTYIGVTSTEDVKEYDDDWSFFDAELDITYTGDFPDNNVRNPLWDGPVGMVGYAFLESPGNAFDGIDNDNDADQNGVFTNASFFAPADFDSILIKLNDKVVLIDKNFNRTLVTITAETTLVSMGKSFHIIPGVTKLVEGNVVLDKNNRQIVNRNAIDGIDNDLDGLIDENYFLHYRQRRQDPATGQILIDKLRPLRFVNYKSGQGMNDNMIDESRSDGIDNNDDWNSETDDVGLDGVADTGDRGENDGIPTSGTGTGLPGEPNIDITDVRESDQIGLTSFDYFTNAQAPTTLLTDDEVWWTRVEPGDFDVPSSIVNNEPVQGEDGDFFYASGYFPLLAKRTERFSLALVYGGGLGGRDADKESLLKNRTTVQEIYDSNYQFPKEPDTPNLSVEVGDGKVVLYWDRISESSFDPVLREYDFEGYRLYKSTDANFEDAFTVTDADGRARGYKPIQQWDLVNDIKGIFVGSADLMNSANGYSWNLGSDTGLRHYYIDTDVENGRSYYYALTAYDRGEAERDIFPSESPFLVTVLPSGIVETGQNTVKVTPGTNVAGYTAPSMEGDLDHLAGPSNGKVSYMVVDEKALNNNSYMVEFLDTSTDGLDNDGDWNILTDDLNGNGKPDSNEPRMDKNDPDEFWPVKTSYYTVRDMSDYSEEVFVDDTIFVELSRQNLAPESIVIKKMDGTVLSPIAYEIKYASGEIRPNPDDPNSEMAPNTNYIIEYQYYPVFKSVNIGEIQTDQADEVVFDTDIFDGVQLSFINYSAINLIASQSGWNVPQAYTFTLGAEGIDFTGDAKPDLIGRRTPHNFKLIFSDSVVYNSLDTTVFGVNLQSYPMNFKIMNTTLNKQVEYVYGPFSPSISPEGFYKLSPKDLLLFFEAGPESKNYFTYLLEIGAIKGQPSTTLMTTGTGVELALNSTLPFRTGDKFTFTAEKPVIDVVKAKAELSQIKVVPNPYVVAHEHEAPLPPLITSGRGERKVTFTHLPTGSKITIFTARGEHVVTINPDSQSSFNGTADWNLKNKENLDIAYGVYFYVVESPIGEKRGKLAIIK
ncbi:MAG: hypothetical protein AB7T22_09080 [Calditrichaceae bacterium]